MLCQAQIKRGRKKLFSLVILYLWIIVSWLFKGFKTSLPDTLFLFHTAQSFDRFRRTMATFDSFRVFAVCFWRSLRTSSSVNPGTIILHWFSWDKEALCSAGSRPWIPLTIARWSANQSFIHITKLWLRLIARSLPRVIQRQSSVK